MSVKYIKPHTELDREYADILELIPGNNYFSDECIKISETVAYLHFENKTRDPNKALYFTVKCFEYLEYPI